MRVKIRGLAVLRRAPSYHLYEGGQAHQCLVRRRSTNILPFEPRDQRPKLGDKIYVAMSGGVDSSVAAALLKQEGHNVEGIFMRNWVNDSKSPGGCSIEKEWKDVQQVAKDIDIPVSRVDLSKDYWNRVFEPALRQFELGQTPNPDIACNREIKFGALIDTIKSKFQGKEHPDRKWWLATGHYARAVIDLRTEKTHLMRSVDVEKDQTYFLSTLEQYALEHCFFPIGTYTKDQVRKIAKESGLHVAEKDDSQGLCFVSPETKHFRDFLSSYLSPGPVRYIDETGNQLSEDNRGLWSSTIGERSGLQLDQGTRALQGKWYVSAKNLDERSIVLVKGADNPRLFKMGAVSTDWIWADYPGSPDKLSVQLRHQQEPVNCIVHHYSHGNVGVFFQNPQRSVAPGQHLAVYSGDLCLGGGTILQPIEGFDDISSIDWPPDGLNPLGL